MVQRFVTQVLILVWMQWEYLYVKLQQSIMRLGSILSSQDMVPSGNAEENAV